MKNIAIIFMAAAFVLSCEGKGSEAVEWPWQDPEIDDPAQLPSESAPLDKWTDVSSGYEGLPSHIKVYKAPETLQGKNAVAYAAVADMASAQWDIWSIDDSAMEGTSDSFKTPSAVYGEGHWPIVINAGFFYSASGKNYSSSLAVRNSYPLAYNITYASEDWKTMYYPTRAAFLESEDGKFDACWTYKTSAAHYMYPVPASNSWDAQPAAQPSATYPEGGTEFAARTAIGGGPVLINEGQFTDSYVEELFGGPSGIAPDSNQPRTAIGITSDGHMVVFVCEGRGMTEGVPGLTTADVANVLLDLGCVEAINLDGGGSSCMLVCGRETIKVSDGSQRAVGSTVMIK